MATKNKQLILGQGKKTYSIALGITTASALLAAWFIISSLGVIPPRFFPTPWRVIKAATDIRPNILVHTAYTMGLVLAGLSVGVIFGVFTGVLMRKSFIARSILTTIVESWRPVPAVAIIPFFIIWFGFAWYGKLLLVSLASFLVIVVGVVEAIDRIDPLYFRVALSFGANNSNLVDKIVIPAILPPLLASCRIALAISITVAVVAEFMGATRGVGHVLNVAMNTFATHTIVLCAIVLGIMGGLIDLFLCLIHKKMVRWSKTADEALQEKQYIRR